MPMYDYRCLDCQAVFERFVHRADTQIFCPIDGAPAEKVFIQAPSVIPDSIPGGMVIENLDRVPRRFDSKSAYRDELNARGLTTERGNVFREDPSGSDKNKHTGLRRWF